MRGEIRFGAITGLVLAALAAGPVAARESEEVDVERACAREAPAGVKVGDCIRDARAAQEWTKRYQDSAVALADGFMPSECVDGSAEDPPEDGAMGEHWFHPGRLQDADGHGQEVVIGEPEILLYIPTLLGRKLVAVEWSVTALVNGQDYFGSETPSPSDTSPAPRLFGRKFDGPMAGHNAFQPWHYDIHVWLWEENPSGVFAHYNPRLSCTPGA